MFGWLIDVPVVHYTERTERDKLLRAPFFILMCTYQNITDRRILVVWIAYIFFLEDLKTETSQLNKNSNKVHRLGKLKSSIFLFQEPTTICQANMKRCCIWAKKKKKKMFDSLFYSVFAPSPQFQNYILLWLLKQDWWENVKYWTLCLITSTCLHNRAAAKFCNLLKMGTVWEKK